MIILSNHTTQHIAAGLSTSAMANAVIAGFISAGPAGAGIVVSKIIIVISAQKLCTLIRTGEIT